MENIWTLTYRFFSFVFLFLQAVTKNPNYTPSSMKIGELNHRIFSFIKAKFSSIAALRFKILTKIKGKIHGSKFGFHTGWSIDMTSKTTPPVPQKKPKKLETHGDIRIDPYFWMKNRGSREVERHLHAENEYTNQMLAHQEEFKKNLFQEMKARIKKDDESVPYFFNRYWYLSRYKKESEYPIYSRKKKSLKAKEELLFDVNEMAQGHLFFQLVGIGISPNNVLASFSTDTIGRRLYTIQIKNLKAGTIYNDKIPETDGQSIWANDNKTLFYVRKDKTLRSFQVYKHVLGTSTDRDILVYEEKDEAFSLYLAKSRSKKYIFIASYSTVSEEYMMIFADNPNAELTVFEKRTKDMEYTLDHFQDIFYIKTNVDGATNFKLMKANETTIGKENWEEVIPHREDVFLEDFELFEYYYVLEERVNGLTNLAIKYWDGTYSDHNLDFGETAYTASIGNNPNANTNILRYNYSSLTTPSSVIDYDMKTKTKTIKKEQEVLGGKFDKKKYKSGRIWATARDGKKIPVSLVYHKDTKKTKNTPLLLYGYGAYGVTIDANFNSIRLSLLDRGFIFAIAHIRGGQYLGRNWYETGKLFHKKNTFFDFINVGKYLIEKKYTSEKHIYAMGGSAGGLLMGAVINYEPELFNGVIASVPFVDVITTMLDENIPLTTLEYDEWGNPNHLDSYEYMKSYSPYDNVKEKKYPNLLVISGYHDSQVQYWEPTKWVAKLRDCQQGKNKILLYTNMEAGHSGASGRFSSLKEIAMEYLFLLDLEGIEE